MTLQETIDFFCKTYLKDLDITNDMLNDILQYFVFKDLSKIDNKYMGQISIKIKEKYK